MNLMLCLFIVSSSNQLQTSISLSRHVDPLETPGPNRTVVPHTALQEAQLEEKRSLDALKTFLSHTCEVLGLWKVLSDHQFHNLAQGLATVSIVIPHLYFKLHL